MKGDFTGFSFDGVHCSELGITRVASGDRYDEELFPEISDRSSEIIGADGENYFGSEYRKKPFSIDIAFDSITETQFRKIRKLFGTKKICELIFDERPYKVYSVKLENPIELNYICFDEEDYIWEKIIIGYDEETGEPIYQKGVTGDDYEYKQSTGNKRRVYKGEGSIELVAYSPFAKQLYKKLDLYTDNNIITKYENIDEWAESSGLLTAAAFDRYNIDKTCTITGTNDYNLKIPVYNPGDLDTGFYLYIPFSDSRKLSETTEVSAGAGEEVYLLSNVPISAPTIEADESISYRVDEEDSHKYYLTNSDIENTARITFNYEYKYTNIPMIQPNTGDYIKIFGDENGLLLNPIVRKSDVETGIIINTVNHLIEGVRYEPVTERNDYREKTWQITHNIYNECIVAGDFPKILRSDWLLDNEDYKQAIYLNCEAGVAENIQINYDYLYF